jgi:hypothetical protein
MVKDRGESLAEGKPQEPPVNSEAGETLRSVGLQHGHGQNSLPERNMARTETASAQTESGRQSSRAISAASNPAERKDELRRVR